MINLLPPEIKTGYKFGRRNVVLRKWVFSLSLALVGLGAIATLGLLTLHQSSVSAQKNIDSAQLALQNDKYEDTQKRVKDISSSFKLVVQVLGQEVLFSQLLKQIATIIPPNASLTGLNINQIQGALDISAMATDYNTATQVQVNLADPANKLFSKADIVSINCVSNQSSDDPTASKYPCTVNVRALFVSNNPYLFINSKGVKP